MADFTRNNGSKKGGLTEDQKGWLVFAGLGVVGIAGAMYLLFLGSDQDEVANTLAQEIKALEGKGYEDKIGGFVKQGFSDLAADPEAQKMMDEMFKGMNYNADLSPVQQFTDGEYGGVKLDSATITSMMSEDSYTDLEIKKKAGEANKYIYETDLKMRYLDGANSWMVAAYETAKGFVELSDAGSLKAVESDVEKITFSDGSGSINYAILNGAVSKFTNNSTADKGDFDLELKVEKIELGQALKFLLGDIKPMSLDFDLNYEGDAFSKLQKIAEQTPELVNYLDNGVELAKKASAAEKYSGEINLNNFSLMSGEMGVQSNLDLEFTGFPYQPVPVGEVKFSIKNYKEIIAYLRNFFPIPEQEVAAGLAEAQKYFSDNGKDLSFHASLDGTKIIKLGNGKEIDLKQEASPEIAAPQPAEDFRSEFETPVESNSKPVTLPEVQTKELGTL